MVLLYLTGCGITVSFSYLTLWMCCIFSKHMLGLVSEIFTLSSRPIKLQLRDFYYKFTWQYSNLILQILITSAFLPVTHGIASNAASLTKTIVIFVTYADRNITPFHFQFPLQPPNDSFDSIRNSCCQTTTRWAFWDSEAAVMLVQYPQQELTIAFSNCYSLFLFS